MESTLSDLGPVALSHRGEVDEVKSQIGINHNYFDCWIYGFLENKKFNIDETVAKLHRRFAMEINELATYEFTDFMHESLRKGIIQEVGTDKEGRVTFYVTTRRDRPTSKRREEQRRTFDMFVSYGTRLRKESKRCQIAMLINQKDASMWSNVDMSFQADVALRISKFYPGGVDKMYICSMGKTLSAMAKPIFSRLPKIVSERIIIVDDSDIKNGKLLEMYDESVLPVELGGKNDCDSEEYWERYAENVEKYYAGLKEAVSERGLSVKDWELEVLTKEMEASGQIPAPPPRDLKATASMMLLKTPRSNPNDSLRRSRDDDARSLITCFSENTEGDDLRDMYIAQRQSTLQDDQPTWQHIMAGFPPQFSVFFLEELLRWRMHVEDDEAAMRLQLLDKTVKSKEKVVLHIPNVNITDEKWYLGIPPPCRDIYKIILSCVMVICTVYFICALAFLAILSSTVIVTIFLGFFTKFHFVFPLTAALMLATMQGAALCSRAMDIIKAILRYKVIPPLARLGTFWGGVAQMTLFFSLVLIQLIVFCVYAARETPLIGLQVSFATGWISATLVVALWHALFFTGVWQTEAESHKYDGKSHTSLAMLITLNLTDEDDGKSALSYQMRLSSYVISGFPIMISMLLGIGFLISRIIPLAVATVVVAILAAFAVNYYSEAVSVRNAGAVLRISLWITTVVWMYDVLAFGLRNYEQSWGASVIVASILCGIFLFLSFLSIYYYVVHWLLRLTFVMLLLLLLACWITQFPLVGWKIGVFTIVMIVHSTLCIIFVRADFTSINGVFFIAFGITMVLISCLLLGWYGATQPYNVPQSTTDPTFGGSPATGALTVMDLYHRYPVCTLRFGLTQGLGIADLALLTEVVGASTTALFNSDFTSWFGATDMQYLGSIASFGDALTTPTSKLHRFDSVSENITFLVHDGRNPADSISAMTAWIDSIALSPLHIFMFLPWTQMIVRIIGFSTFMIPFKWITVTHSLVNYLHEFKAVNDKEVILLGQGIAGGIASLAGTYSSTHTVVFNSPGVLHLTKKMDFTRAAYRHNVQSVTTEYGPLSTIGGQDNTIAQKVFCEQKAAECMSMAFMSRTLLKACDPTNRAHI